MQFIGESGRFASHPHPADVGHVAGFGAARVDVEDFSSLPDFIRRLAPHGGSRRGEGVVEMQPAPHHFFFHPLLDPPGRDAARALPEAGLDGFRIRKRGAPEYLQFVLALHGAQLLQNP